MKRRFLVWAPAVLATVLLLGAGGWLSGTTGAGKRASPQGQSPSRAVSSESDRLGRDAVEELLASIDDRLGQLTWRQAQQERRIANLEVESTSSPPAPNDQPDPALEVPHANVDEPTSASYEQEAQEAKRQFEALETRVLAEPTDPDWRDFAENRIADAFVGELLERSYLESVDCRATLCRASVFHDDEIAMDRFLMVFPSRVGWDWDGSIQVRSEGGEFETVLVLTRERAPLHRE